MTREVQRHNQTVYNNLEEGDLIEFERRVYYSHWAVYKGQGEIIHLSGDGEDGIRSKDAHPCSCSGATGNKGVICIDNFWKVAGKSKANKRNKDSKNRRPLQRQEIIRRAMSQLGQKGYNLLYHNCEHFANWCRYGVEKSDQVDSLKDMGLYIAVALLLLGVMVAVGRRKKKSPKQA